MASIRRTPYAFFCLEDDVTRDLTAVLSGLRPTTSARVLAIALLTGQQRHLSSEETELIMAVPGNTWIDEDELGAGDALAGLLHAGLLVSDTNEPALRALRAREAALGENQWNLYGALYHFMTRWSGVWVADGDDDPAVLDSRLRSVARRLVEEHGAPPPAVADIQTDELIALPGRERTGQLYSALLARRTTRAFDSATPMTLDQLDVVLRYVFGVHGYGRNAADIICIRRTSPSGGGLHPIDVYPIVNSVAGVEPGIYHYNCASHSLAKLFDLTAPDAEDLATGFMCGQRYFGAAQVSFVLTARFSRSHWKYRRHQKAYAGILMDAAHLSQTLYLVSTDLGLGAYVTIAINGRDIEERLGLDGVSEGAIAMAGCGRRAPGVSPLELQFATERPSEEDR